MLFFEDLILLFYGLQVIIHEVDAYIVQVMNECSSQTSTQSPEIKLNYAKLFFFFGIFSASPNASPSSRTYLPESMIHVLLTSSLVFFFVE